MSNDGSDSSDAKKFDIESYWQSVLGKWVRSDVPKKVLLNTTTTKTANFKKDLAKGQQSEHDFYVRYASCLTRTGGRRGDMEINKTGEIIELKSDYYDPNQTENFFFERYSFDDKVGGVWQAAEHGVDYFIYWFPLDGSTYIFNVKQLVRKLNKITKGMDLVSVRNQGYVTRGYKVPREAVSMILLEPESIGLYAK